MYVAAYSKMLYYNSEGDMLPSSVGGDRTNFEIRGTMKRILNCICVHGTNKKREKMSEDINIRKFQDNITWLLGDADQCEAIASQRPLIPFAEETMLFLDAISVELRKKEVVRRDMPEVMAYAFWCRRAHLEELKKNSLNPDEFRLGRKVSLHFAASNMPVLFAFSLTAGLLAGNSCIVRMPGRESPQETVIIQSIKEVTEQKFPEWKGRILLCRYGHDAKINDALSALCDVRVLWGSDAAVREIRTSPLKPGAVDIPFPTRYSAALLDASEVLQTADLDLLAKDFYNDTYLNDQNACSSPRIIFWRGDQEEISKAQTKFWDALRELLLQKKYHLQATVAVQKLDAALMLTAFYPGSKILSDNLITRVQVGRLSPAMWEQTVPGGFFLESGAEALDALAPMLSGICQTLCVYHVDTKKLREWILSKRLDGADRIVPVGHALDFSLTWDGYDLIRMMSRQIGEL